LGKQGAAYEHDVYVRIDLANPGRSFNAVDTGRHANIQEDNGVRLAQPHRVLDSGDTPLSLVARVNLEPGRSFLVRLFSEQYLLQVSESRRREFRFEVAAKAVQVLAHDVLVVVDDQDAIGSGIGEEHTALLNRPGPSRRHSPPTA